MIHLSLNPNNSLSVFSASLKILFISSKDKTVGSFEEILGVDEAIDEVILIN